MNLRSEISNLKSLDLLPLSLLNDYLFCARRAALKVNEGWRSANEHTLQGNLNHDHADLPGFEHRAGWKLLRALPVWSDSLGLNGKADIVEAREIRGRVLEVRPVEYKSGRKSKWVNDHVQLCAQALCLEEMLGLSIPEGMVFHAKSQQRTRVDFDAALRETTRDAIRALHGLFEAGLIPAPELKPQCEGCSLHGICLPEMTRRNRFQLFAMPA